MEACSTSEGLKALLPVDSLMSILAACFKKGMHGYRDCEFCLLCCPCSLAETTYFVPIAEGTKPLRAIPFAVVKWKSHLPPCRTFKQPRLFDYFALPMLKVSSDPVDVEQNAMCLLSSYSMGVLCIFTIGSY